MRIFLYHRTQGTLREIPRADRTKDKEKENDPIMRGGEGLAGVNLRGGPWSGRSRRATGARGRRRRAPSWAGARRTPRASTRPSCAAARAPPGAAPARRRRPRARSRPCLSALLRSSSQARASRIASPYRPATRFDRGPPPPSVQPSVSPSAPSRLASAWRRGGRWQGREQRAAAVRPRLLNGAPACPCCATNGTEA
jgi:hypothetical protein